MQLKSKFKAKFIQTLVHVVHGQRKEHLMHLRYVLTYAQYEGYTIVLKRQHET